MSKLELQAIFEHKACNFHTDACVVEQIVRLPGEEFDFFRNNLLRDYDFIRDNIEAMYRDVDKTHCLLVVGEDRKDGVLVESSGYAYARYAAFVPNAADILERYQERKASVPTAAEKPSVLGKIQEARLTPTPKTEQGAPERKGCGGVR